jgi:glutaconate CoA-transferase subunit B
VHPNVTVDDVRAQTGWDLRIARDVRETEPPSGAELDVLHRLERREAA